MSELWSVEDAEWLRMRASSKALERVVVPLGAPEEDPVIRLIREFPRELALQAPGFSGPRTKSTVAGASRPRQGA